MSRIGKKPIKIPAGVTVSSTAEVVEVKGPKGTLRQVLPAGITVQVADGVVQVLRRNDEKQQRAFHGLIRSLLNNMVLGVSAGFTKELDIIGVGYKAEVQGGKLILSLGYSHPIEFPIPDGISIRAEKSAKKIQNYSGTIFVEGIDRQRVGQIAADIRGFRKPDSYKGKGIRYVNEVIRLKEGKKTA